MTSETCTASAGITCLLVEDDAAVAGLVRRFLLDAQVIIAGSLFEAERQTATYDFDLIIADSNLPDARGAEIIEALHGQAPILVLTAHEDERLLRLCIRAGADDFQSKSTMRRQNLRERVLVMLARRRREAQAAATAGLGSLIDARGPPNSLYDSERKFAKQLLELERTTRLSVSRFLAAG